MEASQHDIRISLLEQADQQHEGTHSRIWDRLNETGKDLAVHKERTDNILSAMREDVGELKDDTKTNRRLLISTLITGLVIAAGLVGNFIVALANQAP